MWTITRFSGMIDSEKMMYFEEKISMYVSILGDSVSTLAGRNPEGYQVFYQGAVCELSGVRGYGDTWWGQVTDALGGELLVNNSWSGSRVTKLPDLDELFPSGCSDERTGGLHRGDILPDIIFVCMGINDWGYRAAIYPNSVLEDTEAFQTAYGLMLKKLRRNYPDAQIWCIGIHPARMSQNDSYSFPKRLFSVSLSTVNGIIAEAAAQNGCRSITFDSHKTLPHDSIDGTHPNRSGMTELANLIIGEMAAQGQEFPALSD